MEGQQTGSAVFRYARLTMLLYVLGGFALSALCAWLFYSLRPSLASYDGLVLAGGTVLFALAAAALIPQTRDRREVVSISAAGIRDIRIAPETIPWSKIRSVSVRPMWTHRFVMLDVEPGFEETLTIPRLARWTRPLNAGMGFPELLLNPAGLDAGVQEIVAAISVFAPVKMDKGYA